jgi:hypothetical protein
MVKPSSDTVYIKGETQAPARFAEGGECLHPTKSRFIKTPDVFRTGTERNDYDKTGKGGEMSEMTGDTKSEKPVKPRS